MELVCGILIAVLKSVVVGTPYFILGYYLSDTHKRRRYENDSTKRWVERQIRESRERSESWEKELNKWSKE